MDKVEYERSSSIHSDTKMDFNCRNMSERVISCLVYVEVHEVALALLDLSKNPVVDNGSLDLNDDEREMEYVNVTEMKNKRIKESGRYRKMLMWNIWEEEHRRWLDDYTSKKHNSGEESEMRSETHKEPLGLKTQLLRFQKEWLSWALKQEESKIKGGILADEMGMGKTVQMIALVLAQREIRGAVTDKSMSEPSSSSMSPQLNCTLVICPTCALHQWESEIKKFTEDETTKVFCYQGPKRVNDFSQFHGYDFVITTYNTIEKDYRRLLQKVCCPKCGKYFSERKLVRHWCNEASRLDKKVNKSHRGKSEPEQYKSALHCVNWERRGDFRLFGLWVPIKLDEWVRQAHCIKDSCSNTAKAIFALESTYKWALTGTPVLNRVGELHSSIRFLQIAPYSYYFCKDCECRVLDYSSSIMCQNCVHKASRHFCWWKQNIARPIEERRDDDEGQRAMILMKHKILANVLLRRTKRGRALDLALPPRIVYVRRDTLDVKEEEFYRSLREQNVAKLSTYLVEGELVINYAAVFAFITRLRQAINHRYLLLYSSAKSTLESDDDNQVCGICHELVEDLVVTPCGHPFCKVCLRDASSSLEEPVCSSCSRPLTSNFTSRLNTQRQWTESKVEGFRSTSIVNRIPLDDFETSTKIDALREEIRFMIERDGSAKGIVFSQHTDFLDLIMYSLQKSGVTCALLDGSMTVPDRDRSIDKFNTNSECRILLISLKSGGFALNLTVASHVFMMDLWWNPATERQAMDRIHRIGQYKPIRIVRFVIEGTIEEKILQIQERKAHLIEGTVGGSSEALNKFTKEQLIEVLSYKGP